MSSSHAHDIKKEVRGYLMVFAALLSLTIVTVGISYLHLSLLPAVAIALTVATVKASLVACYFMHLISEKKLIYCLLGLTFVIFLSVLFSSYPHYLDLITGTQVVP